MKNIDRSLRRIQTQNLAITTSNKHGSTNLVGFFGDFDIINATKVEELEVPKIVIVITRNEKDRWCSGGVQELSRLEDNLDELDKDTIYDILDREVNSLGNKSIFTYDRSHLGENPYFPYIIQLLLNYNTYFNHFETDGYRDENEQQQNNVTAEIRYSEENTDHFIALSFREQII